jgi:hypothetical protein
MAMRTKAISGRVAQRKRGRIVKNCLSRDAASWEREFPNSRIRRKLLAIRMAISRPFSGLDSSSGEKGPGDSGVEAMARVSVTLPRNLYRQFRLHALEQETTMSALLARLIRQEINGSN